MFSERFLYLIPYLIAFFISLSVAGIIWSRRKVKGAGIYVIVVLAQTSIILGYIFELASTTLEGKLFWDDFQWAGLLLWAYLFPIFSLQITESKWAEKKSIWWLLAIVPVGFGAILLTPSLHGWLHKDALLVYGNHFNSLRYDFTPLVWGYAVYGYLSMILSFSYLLFKFFQTHRIYRNQIGAVVIGTGIPLLGYALSLFEITLTFQRDIAPLTLTIGNLVILWGLTRQRLFELIPIARDIIVENIEDAVVVLDEADRIVDLNRSGRELMDMDGENIIGQDMMVFLSRFEKFPGQLEKMAPSSQMDIQIPLGGENYYFDLRSTKIVDEGRELGRVIVARNVTIQKQFEQEILKLNSELEQRVQRRTRALEEAYESTLEGWAKALELRDKETEGHSRRVTELAVRLGEELNLGPEDLVEIRRGALIHDIGKMGIPDEILHKPGPLSAEEWVVMKQHPRIGYDLLSHIPFLERANQITCAHHERWDGAGYPDQLAGEEIPLFARIFTVVDNWDALLSDRPYRLAWEKEKVINYMKENRGAIFDPKVLDAFFEMMQIV
ncbi:MAG: histidine kinase N-terminal 7TM domain-containing protein [Anaerolineales bacterium]